MEQNISKINLYREVIYSLFKDYPVDPIVKEVILSVAILTKGKNLECKIIRVGDKRCGNVEPAYGDDTTKIKLGSGIKHD